MNLTLLLNACAPQCLYLIGLSIAARSIRFPTFPVFVFGVSPIWNLSTGRTRSSKHALLYLMLPLTRVFRMCVHWWREMRIGGRRWETRYSVEFVFVALIWDRHLVLNIQRYCLKSSACAGRATNNGRLRSLRRFRTQQSSSRLLW